MNFDREIQQFKMQLLRKMPFYGDILLQLQILPQEDIPTAATDGRTIWYNPQYFAGMPQAERNFIVMHELFHVLLRHGMRNVGANRDKLIWNVACDLIINNMLTRMARDMQKLGIPFVRPADMLYKNIGYHETAENLYETILADNREKNVEPGNLLLRVRYDIWRNADMTEETVQMDLEPFPLLPEERKQIDQAVRQILQAAAIKHRSDAGSYMIPRELLILAEGKVLNWKKLLRSFLDQETGEDTSYTTPERKYLHMDMILPGHSLSEETLEEVWAFVDSSGSVGWEELCHFLTQVYHIAREYKCTVNICYWDTQVTDTYLKIRREKDILNCQPHHSGGTDINCVYRWIREKKVKPDVMLILTDGYFGRLQPDIFAPRLGKRTILVLSSDIPVNADMKKIGKIARLKERNGK